MGRFSVLPAGLVVLAVAALASLPTQAASSDAEAFMAEAGKLQGHPLSIVTSNGPVSPQMTAELRFDGKETFSVVTTIARDDGTSVISSEEAYRFEPAEAGLSPRHFKTMFTRTVHDMPYEMSCDSFFFAGNNLQLDCFKPENYAVAHAGVALTVIWELKPDVLNIRLIANGGSATLSAKR